ncbi:MAG: PAS-domain containing protein [Gemmobacter sp.]
MIPHGLVNPADSVERQNQKLGQIIDVLMRRVEQINDDGGQAYALFQRAVTLEDQVRERTRDLERALDLLNTSNARLEAANRETENARQDLSSAIETIQEGFALFDAEDRLVLCNSRFGMHMPDILQRIAPGLAFADYVEIVSGSRSLHLPDAQSAADWAARRMARHREAHVMFNVALTGDRWVQVSEHRMPGGQTVVMQTDVSDIMRRERIERGRILDDQARLVRATLDHLNQGICIFDRDRLLVGFNERLASLLSLPRLRSGLDFDLILRWVQGRLVFPQDITPQVLLDWVDAPGLRPPLRFELRRGDGQTLDVFAQEMPDRGFVISFTDVSTERNAARSLHEANEQLEMRVAERTLELEDALATAKRANAARTRFVAAASHDLLQPLSAAKLFLSSVRTEIPDPAQREAVTKAEGALSSVEEIIEALLDISKLESGQAAVSVAEVDLDPLLAKLCDEFLPMAARKGLTLRLRPSGWRVVTDARLIRRVLQNLIANAVRYTDRGGILVGARRVRRNVRIEVWDTGRGIPESEFENVFREFHRLDPGAGGEGLGLGLAIVDRACALLDHPVQIRSRLGRGSVFRLSVPWARAATGAGPTASRAAGGGTWSFPGLVVLLIENDREMRQALCLLLEKWDVQVIDVGSGPEAMALLHETGLMPDALLVDFQLDEGARGTDLIADILAMTGPLPARIVTANRTPAVLDLCRVLSLEVLHKPIDPVGLRSFLAAVGTGGDAQGPGEHVG